MNIRTRLLEAYEDGLIDCPCVEALDWLGRRRSLQKAWDDCPDGSHMLWLMEQAGAAIPLDWMVREIVAPALLHAAKALDTAGIEHSLREHAAACATAPSEEAAARAAEATAETAAADAEAADAWAAARAASAAAAAARAASWAASAAALAAAGAATAAFWAAAYWAARATELLRIADAVRVRWPTPPPEVLALLEAS